MHLNEASDKIEYDEIVINWMHTFYVPHTFTRSAVAKKTAGARSSKVKNTTCMVPAVLASTTFAYRVHGQASSHLIFG